MVRLYERGVRLEWHAPWHSVDADTAAKLQAELQRELPAQHPVFGLPATALARRQDCDDVLFAIEDGTGRVAVVHLTWTRSMPERLPCPRTRVFPSLATWESEGMLADAAGFE
jgi:hypothetical protein